MQGPTVTALRDSLLTFRAGRVSRCANGLKMRSLARTGAGCDIAVAILEGRQLAGLTVKGPCALPDLPLEWSARRRRLG
jgi:hypothetical protein